MITYIVIWTEIDNYDVLFTNDEPRQEAIDAEEHIDYWHVTEDYESAEEIYNDLLDQGDRILTCSIVIPVKSTDYEEVVINV